MAASNLMPALQLSARAGVAAALAIAISQALRFQSPLHALVTAVLVLDLSAQETRRLALPRFGGTLLGAVTGALMSQMIRPNPISIGLGITAAMFLTYLLGLRRSTRVAGYVCGIVLLSYTDAPWTYAGRRLIETTLGIVLAVLVSSVPKLIPAGEPEG